MTAEPQVLLLHAGGVPASRRSPSKGLEFSAHLYMAQTQPLTMIRRLSSPALKMPFTISCVARSSWPGLGSSSGR